jgi:ribosome-associated translation inhibitor RaiA
LPALHWLGNLRLPAFLDGRRLKPRLAKINAFSEFSSRFQRATNAPSQARNEEQRAAFREIFKMGRKKRSQTFKPFLVRKDDETIMIQPLQTTFRNMDESPAVAARVQEEAEKLGKYFDRITSCRVIVEAPHRHHLHGESFHIRIELRVPGKELVVAHEPPLRHEEQPELHKHLEADSPHKNVYVAIREAFKAMRRQLQDYVHCLRHEVKTHHPALKEK